MTMDNEEYQRKAAAEREAAAERKRAEAARDLKMIKDMGAGPQRGGCMVIVGVVLSGALLLGWLLH
jgi:hypothetical protein